MTADFFLHFGQIRPTSCGESGQNGQKAHIHIWDTYTNETFHLNL